MELSLINFYEEHYQICLKEIKNIDRFQIEYCSKQESKIMTKNTVLIEAAEGRTLIRKLATIIHS